MRSNSDMELKGKSRKRKMHGRKFLLTAIAAVFLGTAAVGTSLAFLIDQTGSITNTFTGSKIEGEITEEFDKAEKKNVAIKNNGDIAAYVRVALIPSWVYEDGKVSAEVPVEETDYVLVLSKNGWKKGTDGFYYYRGAVPAGGSTGVLVESCKPVQTEKKDAAGNVLHFEYHVVASLIQAEPDAAVKDAWHDEAFNLVKAEQQTETQAE